MDAGTVIFNIFLTGLDVLLVFSTTLLLGWFIICLLDWIDNTVYNEFWCKFLIRLIAAMFLILMLGLFVGVLGVIWRWW